MRRNTPKEKLVFFGNVSKGSKLKNKPVWECRICPGTLNRPYMMKGKPVCPSCGDRVIYHQSQKEFKRWKELQQLEKAGQIRNLRRQVKFTFEINGDMIKTPKGRDLTYTADFVYDECFYEGTAWVDTKQVVEDAKGRKSGNAYDLYWLKRELMRLCHGIEVRES